MSFTESSIQFAPHGVSAAEANIFQQDEQPNIDRRHTIIENMPWTNVNKVHSEVDQSGYQIMDNVDSATVGISMQKNRAYSGLVLANAHVQEFSMPPRIELTSEQDISSSESSSEDDHVFIDSMRWQNQHRDDVGLLFRAGELNHGAALTSVVHSDAVHQDQSRDIPEVLGSEQQAEDQSTCAIDAQHDDCDEEQSLLVHQNTDSEGKSPVHLPLQSETSSSTSNENQQLTSYEHIWGYERVYHCDIPLESLLYKDCTKPEDTCS